MTTYSSIFDTKEIKQFMDIMINDNYYVEFNELSGSEVIELNNIVINISKENIDYKKTMRSIFDYYVGEHHDHMRYLNEDSWQYSNGYEDIAA